MKQNSSHFKSLTAGVFAAATILLVNPVSAQTADTAFHYQGRLTDSNSGPLDGPHDLRFTLYASEVSITELAAVTNLSVVVSQGLFSTAVDLGDAIANGGPHWLEIGVRPSGQSLPFTPLLPRQKIHPIPTSLYAHKAGTTETVEPAAVDTDALADNAVTSNKIASGAIQPEQVDLAAFDSIFWQLEGNAGTTAGLNYLGTTDNQPLEIKVNAQRALRIEPTAGGPNLIGGHFSNQALGAEGVAIAGGAGNVIQSGSDWSFIGSGEANVIETNAPNAVIAGGDHNRIRSGAHDSFIGSGEDNWIRENAIFGFIGGGSDNGIRPEASYSTIAGGGDHRIGEFSTHATVAGGRGNNIVTNSPYASIGGGSNNVANGAAATVGGGQDNHANGDNATVGGGGHNSAEASAATVSGGWYNIASDLSSTVGGGYYNTASDWFSTVGGGYYNTANSYSSTVGGGDNNTASAFVSTVGGGQDNTASGNFAAVGGGSDNTASGHYSTVPGGDSNVANGHHSFAAGRRAHANHDGSFVWADDHNFDFSSTVPHGFFVRSTGGVKFVTGINSTTGAETAGVRVTQGSSAWTTLCDRNSKENFKAVNVREVLERLATIPIQTWNWKAQEDGTRHIGPMAQDFYAAFEVGEDERHITTVDADGVALAAIQGLNQKLEETRTENAALKTRLAQLEKVVSQITNQQ